MPGKIFISYRREDERSMAARVRDRLVQEFGEENVFMDVDTLLPGQRFDAELKKALDDSSILLAVIGPKWMLLLEERQKSGERDFVREEIGKALASGITVIPLMLEGAPMPRAADLPEDIREFVLHQKHTIGYEQFGRDVAALVEAVRKIRIPAPTMRFLPRVLRSKVGATIAALAVISPAGLIAYRAEVALPWPLSHFAEGTRTIDVNASKMSVFVVESEVMGIEKGDILSGDRFITIPYSRKLLVSVSSGSGMRLVEIRGQRHGPIYSLLEPESMQERLWALGVEFFRNAGASDSQKAGGR